MARFATILWLVLGAGLAVAGGNSRAPAAKGDDLRLRISKSITRGVAWLRKRQKANGAFGPTAGETALCLMALRHSGVSADDRACAKAEKRLRRALPDRTVYGAALGILALLEQPREPNRKLLTRLARELVRGQCRNGQWSYSYRSSARKKAGDNSNTQIALLALAAWRDRGGSVPKETFQRSHAYFLAHQNEDGGFGYSHNQRSRSYGSMTAGIAMSMALCGEDGAPLDRAWRWLAREFHPKWNRGAARAFGNKKAKRTDAFWRHYWLWSLERAGSVAKRKSLGRHDWYRRGAQFLVGRQRDDGAWRDPERDLLATPFALLFFARSGRRAITPRPGEVVITESGRKK